MSTVHYPAIVERAGKSFSVYFPDLPGCASAGESVQQAALNAEEALAGHIAVMEQHGEAVPPPSDFDAVAHDPDVDEVARVLVRAERPGRSIRVQISMDEGLVRAIDRIAPNRSRFLDEAARAMLAARR